MEANAEPQPPAFELVPVKKLHESPLNPRHHFDADALKELQTSIEKVGVLTPLLVRPNADGYEIAAGHRRLRAAKAAGLKEVPAIVRPLTDTELLEVLVIENGQRADVHPLEEAEGYRALIKRAGYDVARIAERVGRSVKYVYDRIKLLALTKEAKALFFAGKITAGHAILLARLKPEDQKRAIGERPRNEYDRRPSGVFTYENARALDFGDEEKEDPLKPVSVREFQSWIDENCRFDPGKDDTPDLFPETHAAIVESKEQEEKVIPITREYHVDPAAKDPKGARTYGPMSWTPATGKVESESYGPKKRAPTCDRSVLGVFVIGPGRGETMRVCIDKACVIHWGREKREKAKAASSTQSFEERQKREQKRWAEQRARDEAERRRWEKAVPALLEAFAEKIAAAKGIGQIADLVLRHCAGRVEKRIAELAPKGKTADAVLRRAAFLIVAGEASDSWHGRRACPKLAKAFGVDLPKILATAAPKDAVQTSAKRVAAKS